MIGERVTKTCRNYPLAARKTPAALNAAAAFLQFCRASNCATYRDCSLSTPAALKSRRRLPPVLPCLVGLALAVVRQADVVVRHGDIGMTGPQSIQPDCQGLAEVLQRADEIALLQELACLVAVGSGDIQQQLRLG